MEKKKKIILAFIGSEQGSWGNIAFTRPSHYYVMPGILCVAQALRNDPLMGARVEIECLYFNRSVENADEIARRLGRDACDLLGLSTYCWNIDDNLAVAHAFGNSFPSTRIVMGGPEVSMENRDETDGFFGRHPCVHGLLFGESERTIGPVVRALLFDDAEGLSDAKGYALSRECGGHACFDTPCVDRPDHVPQVYPFEIDVPRSPGCGLAIVYETGRGCPYRCIYCRFGHRNLRPFRFDIGRVRREIEWLLEQKFDCIHFADAVFDLDTEYAKSVLRIIIERNISTSIFFYCSLQKLDEELAGLFEQCQCQIGVGVQSTNRSVLRTIQRSLSTAHFAYVGRILAGRSVNFYTDLIYGLPNDNPESFSRSFDETLGLNPAFVMPFPLTLIRDTPLGDSPGTYGVRPLGAEDLDRLGLMCDIQYDNIGLYHDFSPGDLSVFDDVALALFYFYNRFPLSIGYLRKKSRQGPFALFHAVGSRAKAFLRRVGRRASNTGFIEGFEDEIFGIFRSAVAEEGAGEKELSAFHELFKLDIFRLLILESPVREKVFLSVLRHRDNRVYSMSGDDSGALGVMTKTHGKIVSIPYRLHDLVRCAELGGSIQPGPSQVLVHAPFERWNASFRTVSPMERFLIDFVPSDRPVPLDRVTGAAQRHFAKRGGGDGGEKPGADKAVESLVRDGIFAVFHKERRT
jgi:radical SAM superfamily enzyme YgiQ (UPF0313 family)